MKCCLSLTLAALTGTTGFSHSQTVPNPLTFPSLFGPAGELTATAPPVPAGSLLEVHFGGTASGNLGPNWTATANGGAVLGSNIVTELRVAESGAQVALTGTALQFNLDSKPDSILGALGTGAGLALNWSATATLNSPAMVLKPNTVYRVRFDVDAGAGLLSSSLAISPTFGVELLNGAGTSLGYSGGGTVANLIGLQLDTVLGAPAGSGTASLDFSTGASVPAGNARVRFTGSASLPLSVVGIGTEFASVSNLTIGEVDAYTLWIEDSGVPDDQADGGDDPDGDGRSNFDEFAVSSDPAVGDSNNIHGAIGDPDGAGTETSVFVMTLPVRSGADFNSVGGDQVGAADGVNYRVEGSFELIQWTAAISEVTPNSNFSNNLPELPEGWEYRSFRVPGQTSDTPRAFLRAVFD